MRLRFLAGSGSNFNEYGYKTLLCTEEVVARDGGRGGGGEDPSRVPLLLLGGPALRLLRALALEQRSLDVLQGTRFD